VRVLRSAAALAAVLGFATLARADSIAPPSSYSVPEQEFWEQAIEPHGADVRVVIDKATLIIQQLPYLNDSDPTGLIRQRAVDDGIGMLRYARRLDPKNTEVLRNLGTLADEGGQTELALTAFDEYMEEIDDDSKIPSDVYMRLGRIHARLREYDEAVHALRKSLVANVNTGGYYFQYSQGHTLVALSSSLAASGRLADAIDTLKTYLTRIQYYGDEPSVQAGFALAVAYDRDEQRSNAFEMLDLLINASQGSYGVVAYSALSRLSFTPAIDQHYYYALLYESLGYLSEARTEWQAYARGGDEALFRGRALDHVESIDAMLEEKVAKEQADKKASRRRGRGGAATPAPTPTPPVVP
jgi:tetratricopeptide (TPR) repeat protein